MNAARYVALGLAAWAVMGGVAALAQTANSADPAPSAAAPAKPAASGFTAGALGPGAKKGGLSEGVAAVVNDEIISTYDLRQRVLLVLVLNGVQPTEQNLREIERESLRSLVDERLEMQEIHSIEAKNKDVHLELSPKEMDDELNDMAQQYGVKRAQLISTLAGAGVELKTLTDQVAVGSAWRSYIGGRFHGTIRIGEDQVNQEQLRMNASASKAQYQVSEILIDASAVGGEDQAVAGAHQLLDQIKKGAPFGAVARQFSSLPTAANGGDAGWLTAGTIQPVLENALSSMRVGQVSDPILVPQGVYLIQLRDKHAGVGVSMVSLKQAAVRIPADATPAQTSAAEAKLNTLRASFKTCADLESDAEKVDGVVAGDLGETDVNDLSPEFKSVVDKLKVGEIGGPVRTKAGLHLVAVCGRRAAGAQSMTRDQIEGKLQNEQLSMIARRFLRDLRNSATIESR